MISFATLDILNPKRESEAQTGRASWYPYYAGFSEKFAHRLIGSADLKIDANVSDPWNGSGTTTAAAAGLGHNAFGYDLNPVMVLAARARMLSKREKRSLTPLAAMILKESLVKDSAKDALNVWFTPASAMEIRAIEKGIQRVLMEETSRFQICTAQHIKGISDLAAFFYVALFRTTRTLLQRFDASNPTWIKKPANAHSRLRPSGTEVRKAFAQQVDDMMHAIDADSLSKDSEVQISVGCSSSVPLKDQSIDFVLSSPPYCTRIDYAVATQPELAILGYHSDDEFDDLRRKLIGTSTVPETAPMKMKDWGDTCLNFLDRLSRHPSKASKGYYLKNHLQYFDSIFRSVGEISRTLKKNGACVLVVQDSYYKEIHNNVPCIISEMAGKCGLQLKREVPFYLQRTMAGVNPEVRKYRSKVDAVETVLCFKKN